MKNYYARLCYYGLSFVLSLGTSAICAQTLTLKWKTDTIFKVPESVYFDTKNDVLYVANIEGKSDQKDGKGFISQLTPDGKIKNLEWVTGLHAPKGMGLAGNILYVADLSRVVAIDITAGKIVNTFEIEGAQFLNDITVDTKGNVYISDSATGKIYKISNNKATLYFESSEFKRVNGLLALKDGHLYVVDNRTGTNYILSADKKLTTVGQTAAGADGVVPTGKDEYIVSSWNGEVQYVDSQSKVYPLLDTKEQKLNCADIDYDPKTKTVFIPTFFGNSVMAYTFKK